MKSLLSNIGIYIGWSFFAAILSLFGAFFFAATLPKNDFGSLVFFQMIMTNIATLSCFGLPAAYLKLRVEERFKFDLRSLFSTCIHIFLGTFGVMSFVAFVIFRLGSGTYTATTTLLSLFAAALLGLILLSQAVVQGAEDAGLHGRLTAGRSLMSTTLGVGGVFFISPTYEVRVMTILIALLVYSVFTLRVTRKYLNGRHNLSEGSGRSAKSQVSTVFFWCLKQYPIICLGVVIAIFDRWYVERFFGLSYLAEYGLAFQLAIAVRLLTQAINRAYSPWFFNNFGRNGGGVQPLKFSTGYVAAAIVLSIVCYFLAPVVNLFLPRSYEYVADILRFLVFGRILFAIAENFALYLYRDDKQGVMSVIVFLSLIIQVAFTFGNSGAENILIPAIGYVYGMLSRVAFIFAALFFLKIPLSPSATRVYKEEGA